MFKGALTDELSVETSKMGTDHIKQHVSVRIKVPVVGITCRPSPPPPKKNSELQ
jgi:hypothetical protein